MRFMRLLRPSPGLRWRSLLGQCLVLFGAVVLGWWLVRNAVTNLAARNVASGFGFLKDTAGFAISEGWLTYDMEDSYLRALAAGLANTLRAALPAVVLATALGFALGLAQISKHPVLSRLARLYVDVIRNIPLLVQVLLWYFALTQWLPSPDQPMQWMGLVFLSKGGLAFALPESASMLWVALAGTLALGWVGRTVVQHQSRRMRAALLILILLAGICMWALVPLQWELPQVSSFGITGGTTLSPEWVALVGTLSLYGAAYCAEVVRAGLQAVPKGQWESGHALGLTWGQTLSKVILPQGLRVMVPPYTSLVMNTIKNSSLAVAVGYPDVVSVATTAMNQNGQAIECIAIIAGVYLMLNLVTALVMGMVNRRVQIKER